MFFFWRHKIIQPKFSPRTEKTMTYSEYIKKRNVAIYRLRKKGSLLKEIALKYAVSTERIG